MNARINKRKWCHLPPHFSLMWIALPSHADTSTCTAIPSCSVAGVGDELSIQQMPVAPLSLPATLISSVKHTPYSEAADGSHSGHRIVSPSGFNLLLWDFGPVADTDVPRCVKASGVAGERRVSVVREGARSEVALTVAVTAKCHKALIVQTESEDTE